MAYTLRPKDSGLSTIHGVHMAGRDKAKYVIPLLDINMYVHLKDHNMTRYVDVAVK